ncbi:hypothetical protein JHK86_016128 [Glycine max]|nr:hypothetical protein JHK86_016128 [Glycine max]
MGVDVWFGLTRSDSAIIRRNITQFWPRIEECRKQLENLCNSQEDEQEQDYLQRPELEEEAVLRA